MRLYESINGGTPGMSMPVWVTRKTADGLTAAYSMPLAMTMLAIVLVWLNVVGWGLFGIYDLIRFVVS